MVQLHRSQITTSPLANIPERAPRPRVSIGLPVFNGGNGLREALRSLLNQSYTDFEIIISDNASTDSTATICEALSAGDPRIRYHRQPKNLGAFPNFVNVLDRASGEFFMWAAADDWWSSNFIETTVAALDARPELISAITPVRFEGSDFDPYWVGDGLLQEEDTAERVLRFVSSWHANSVFYSMFRRQVLAFSIRPVGTYLGFDWSIMLRATVQGPSLRLSNGEMIRGSRGESSSGRLFAAARHRTLNWALPFYDMSIEGLRAVGNGRLGMRLRVASALARLNYSAFKGQLRYELGRDKS